MPLADSGFSDFSVQVATRPLHRPQYGDIAGQPGLPPVEVRLIGPREKIDTPVDDRGLIDIMALIRNVKATIDLEYVWPSNLSQHHFYWPDALYSSPFLSDPVRAQSFRGLPIHQGLMPREFENWTHAITIPASVPHEYIMQQSIESWSIAHSLFMSMRQAIRWERRARKREADLERNPNILPPEFNGEDVYGKAFIAETLRKHFSGIERNLVRMERIPPELRLVEINAPPEVLAQQLGELIVPKSLRLVRAVAA